MPLYLASAVAAGLLLCPAAAATGAAGQAEPSAHWRATVTVEGAQPGQPLQEAQVWLLGGRIRIEERGKAAERINVLLAGAEVYIWVEGERTGTRLAAGLAARGRPLHTFVRRTEEIRSRGRKSREEIVDGHACEVFEYESPQDGKGIYWLARDLGHFPVKAIVERRHYLPYSAEPIATVKLEYRNRDVRIGEPVPETKLSPPAGVRFEDATELMLRGGPRRR
ncbi:MAG: hypothetical protein ACRD3M_11765 [Thermoanaerobaculia bacterium]